MGINGINGKEEGGEREIEERHNESSSRVQNHYCETVVQYAFLTLLLIFETVINLLAFINKHYSSNSIMTQDETNFRNLLKIQQCKDLGI